MIKGSTGDAAGRVISGKLDYTIADSVAISLFRAFIRAGRGAGCHG